MSYADLGNRQGRIYAVKDGKPHVVENNDFSGVQVMKKLALQSRAIAVRQRGYFTIEVTSITGSGNITQVNVDSINQIGSSVAYTSGNEAQLAIDLADEITNHVPGSGVNYLAKAVGDIVYCFAPEGSNTSINGDSVGIADTGNITISATDVAGATDQSEVYDTNTGFRFYIDSSASAPINDHTGGDEITKYIVPRTLDAAIPNNDVTLASDIATIDRASSMAFVKLSCESGNTDNCIGIVPTGFANGDIVYASGANANNEITFTEDANGNIYLRNSENFVSTGTGTWIMLRYEDGAFYEVNRASIATSFESLTRAQALSQMAAGTITEGKFYKITDIGHRGVILQGISTTELSVEGSHIAAVPDWQDNTGDFEGVWDSGASYSTDKLVVWGAGLMYINTTGSNGASNPSVDTTNWTLVDRATSELYVEEIHRVTYDITANLFRKVEDGRGNSISEILNTYPDWFVFGCDDVTNNTVIAKSSSDAWVNSNSNMSFRGGGSEFKNNTLIDSTTSIIVQSGVGRQFNNNLLINSKISGKVGADPEMFYVNENILNGANIELNPDDATPLFIQNVVTGLPGSAQTVEILWDQTFSRNRIDIMNTTNKVLFDQGHDYQDEVLSRYNSSFEIERSVSSNELGLDGLFGEILVASGGGTETVNTVTWGGGGSGEHPIGELEYIMIKPKDGVTLTLTGADPTSPSNGDILIPLMFQDEASASPSASGSASGSASASNGQLTLEGSKNEYAIVRLFGDTLLAYAVVERVVQF